MLIFLKLSLSPFLRFFFPLFFLLTASGCYGPETRSSVQTLDPVIIRSPDIKDPEEVERDIKDSLRHGQETIEKWKGITEPRSEIHEAFSRLIRDSITPFNRTAAARLESVLSDLYDVPADRTTQLGDEIETLARALDQYQNTECLSDKRCQAKDLAKHSLEQSVTELTSAARVVKGSAFEFQESMETQRAVREIGLLFLDLATSTNSGVSAGRNAYEAITGYSFMTDEELPRKERAMATMVLQKLGIGQTTKETLKLIRLIADAAKEGGIQVLRPSVSNKLFWY